MVDKFQLFWSHLWTHPGFQWSIFSGTVINRKMLEADIRKFNFLPSNMMKDKAFTIDVKKEIYRFILN